MPSVMSTMANQINQSIDLRDWRVWVGGGAFMLGLYWIRLECKRRKLPRGPRPYPIVGNYFLLHGKFWNVVCKNLVPKYGSTFTLFLGHIPVVILNDLDVASDSFKLPECSGRPQLPNNRLFIGNEGKDIIFSDFGRDWEVLRRVAYGAVRKYSASDKLAEICSDVVDMTFELILLDNENGNKSFDPKTYIYLLVFNVIAQTAFGTHYEMDDPEFIRLTDNNVEFERLSPSIIATMVLPILKVLPSFRKAANRGETIMQEFRDLVKEKYAHHLDSFTPGVINDFCDALLDAKAEAVAEDRDSKDQLTDSNIALTLVDLFMAGSDTTKFTLAWALLLMANYPDVQSKLREEVSQFDMTQMIKMEHKPRLNYVQAFVYEVLRFRPVSPLGVGHTTTSSIIVDGFRLEKGTIMMYNLYSTCHDERFWKSPETFEPERFRDTTGKFDARPAAFVPFGTGRRSCLGKNLAINEILFIVCRLLQNTRAYDFVLDGCEPGHADLDGDLSINSGWSPKPYKLKLQVRE